MKKIINQFPKLFVDKTGKYKGDPIKIQIKPNATHSTSKANIFTKSIKNKKRTRKDAKGRYY